MSCVFDILAKKGTNVACVSEGTTVLRATEVMNSLRIGAVLIMAESGRVAGIFTERDVLRRVVVNRLDPALTLVDDVMTTRLITCRPSDDISSVAEVMRDQRLRHLPVLDPDSDRPCGLISIGDVNAIHVGEIEATASMLSEYVYGRG